MTKPWWKIIFNEHSCVFQTTWLSFAFGASGQEVSSSVIQSYIHNALLTNIVYSNVASFLKL